MEPPSAIVRSVTGVLSDKKYMAEMAPTALQKTIRPIWR